MYFVGVGRMLTASAGIEVRAVSENATRTDLKLKARLFEYIMTYGDVFSNLSRGLWLLDSLRTRRAYGWPACSHRDQAKV